MGGATSDWRINLILSVKVRAHWKPPLEPSGPAKATAVLRVLRGKVDLTPLQRFYDAFVSTEPVEPCVKEAGELLFLIQERLLF